MVTPHKIVQLEEYQDCYLPSHSVRPPRDDALLGSLYEPACYAAL